MSKIMGLLELGQSLTKLPFMLGKNMFLTKKNPNVKWEKKRRANNITLFIK